MKNVTEMNRKDRVYLRAIEPDDYLVSQKWRNDFDLIKGYTAPRYVSLETERKWVQKVIEENESGRSVRVGICTVGEDRLIGYANLLNIDYRNRNCEFSIIIGDSLTPKSLGALLAHFENKIMFQGFLWNFNSFDQEGVQLGKVLAKRVLAHETDGALKIYSDLLNI